MNEHEHGQRSGVRDERRSRASAWRFVRTRGHALLLLQPQVPRALRGRPRALPSPARSRRGSGSPASGEGARRGPCSRQTRDNLAMPDGPGGSPRPSRGLSKVRHGTRTGRSQRRASKRGARRHEAKALGRGLAERTAVRDRHERDVPGPRPDASVARPRARPARARLGYARLPLGRTAVLGAWASLAAEPKPEHVHLDRAGRGRRLHVQRGRWSLPVGFRIRCAPNTASSACTSRRRP